MTKLFATRVLGEFINLPKSSNKKTNARFCSVGLGFNPKNNKYKVIRVLIRQTMNPVTGICRTGGNMAEVHTVKEPKSNIENILQQ